MLIFQIGFSIQHYYNLIKPLSTIFDWKKNEFIENLHQPIQGWTSFAEDGSFDLRYEVFVALTKKIVIRHPGDKIAHKPRSRRLSPVLGRHAIQKSPIDIGILVSPFKVAQILVKEQFKHELYLWRLLPDLVTAVDAFLVEDLQISERLPDFSAEIYTGFIQTVQYKVFHKGIDDGPVCVPQDTFAIIGKISSIYQA